VGSVVLVAIASGMAIGFAAVVDQLTHNETAQMSLAETSDRLIVTPARSGWGNAGQATSAVSGKD
jgi:hypothetical protein